MMNDSGHVGVAEQALVNEARSGLHPSGFDPSCGFSAGIEAAARVVEGLKREVPYDYNRHPCSVTKKRAAAAIRAINRATNSPKDIERFVAILRATNPDAYVFEHNKPDTYTFDGDFDLAAVFAALAQQGDAAQGIEARSDTTRSGVAEGESPVPQGCATQDTPNPEPSHV